MWGQVQKRISVELALRIIPTRVGTRKATAEVCGSWGDHPHACGDKKYYPRTLDTARGSSPRVWGQVCMLYKCAISCRIIPTRVGTRRSYRRGILFLRDHPHACGDKFPIMCRLYLTHGSSPRVWGQGLADLDMRKSARIIPTRVGTRNFRICPYKPFQDHPHACGDKSNYQAFPNIRLGSSPRVWGQGKRATIQLYITRIIPTRVGTRSPLGYVPRGFWDHPHACGDKRISDFL